MGNKHALGCKHPPRTDDFKANQAARMMGNQRAKGCKHQPENAENFARRSAGKMGDKNPMKRWETKVNHSLIQKLHNYEKQLEAAGSL